MDILSTWSGRIALVLLAFPILMLGVPLLIATVRQKLNWDKRQPADAGLVARQPADEPGRGDPALRELIGRGGRRRFMT